MRNKLLSVVLALTVCIGLSACGGDTVGSTGSSTGSTGSSTGSQDISIDNAANDKDLLNDIIITNQLDETMQMQTVFIENKSKKTFTGDIHVRFYNIDNKSVGYDMIIVEDLKPGSKTFAKIAVNEIGNLTMKYEFSSKYKFDENKELSNEDQTANSEWSEDISNYMAENFGGFYGEYPEMVTSWYPSIKNIQAYQVEDSQNSSVIVTVNSNDESAASRIGHTILVNYNNRDERKTTILSVTVQDEDSNTIFYKEK